jgi:hypothetical protein
VSRENAILMLRGYEDSGGLVTGLAWLPAGVLTAVEGDRPGGDLPISRAAVAAELGVDLAFVASAEDGAAEGVAALHAAEIASVWTVDGVFGRVAREMGWPEALAASVAEPGALAAPLASALHDALVDVRRGHESGADAVLVADDLAGSSGPLLSPDYALDALVPCYHRLAMEAGDGGLPALFHSDGDIRMLVSALARAGFSAVHLAGLGPDALVAAASSARAAGLTVLGGITVAELATGPREAGERAASTANSLGRVIVCDDGGITTAEEIPALGAALGAAREAFG